jgi:hypothetical protein
MYFIVYKLYYVGQNDDPGIHVRLRNWEGGSNIFTIILMLNSQAKINPTKLNFWATLIRDTNLKGDNYC